MALDCDRIESYPTEVLLWKGKMVLHVTEAFGMKGEENEVMFQMDFRGCPFLVQAARTALVGNLTFAQLLPVHDFLTLPPSPIPHTNTPTSLSNV